LYNDNCFIIAIDGTAASGKGTLSKYLAQLYGLDYLDTGALYRRAGHALIEKGADLNNLSDVLHIISNVNYIAKIPSQELHTEEVGRVASTIAAIKEVRKVLNKIQFEFPIGRKGVIIDGRDIGTVIFPNANLKLFITASIDERARRRFKQLSQIKPELTYEKVLADLLERDERDKNRNVAPTVAAPDALVIDTSKLDEREVLALVKTITADSINNFIKP
jgi:cytidylate kinase